MNWVVLLFIVGGRGEAGIDDKFDEIGVRCDFAPASCLREGREDRRGGLSLFCYF